MEERVTTTRRGTCNVCGNDVAYSAMWTHLKKHVPADQSSVHIIRVYGMSPFWMYLQVPSNSTLKKLDEFLRMVWLECCGHLSTFIINDEEYDAIPDDSGMFERRKSMRYTMSKVLEEKMVFWHEYDYGTTTKLRLDVKAAGVPPLIKKKGIVLLALHDKAKFICDECGGDASKICPLCGIYKYGSLLCDDCVHKHPCVEEEGEGYMLDAVQSPRVGMCAYDSESPLPSLMIRQWQKSA